MTATMSERMSDEQFEALVRWFSDNGFIAEARRARESEERMQRQAESDWRVACDALGWAHELHGKTLPDPSRAVRALVEQRGAALEQVRVLTKAVQDMKRTCRTVVRGEAAVASMALSGAIDVADAALVVTAPNLSPPSTVKGDDKPGQTREDALRRLDQFGPFESSVILAPDGEKK